MSDIYYDFPGYLSLNEKIEHLRQRAIALQAMTEPAGEYQRHLGGAILEVAKLYSSFAGCMELLAKTMPYSTGDRVRLVRAPRCESGWSHCKHFLVAGAVGTVKSVELDYLMRDWSLYVEFDDESWIPSFDYDGHKKGVPVPTPPDRRHVFGFGPDWVEKVDLLKEISTASIADRDPGDE